MLSYGTRKVLPRPTVGTKCSYPTLVEVVSRGVVGSHTTNAEPNGVIDDNRVEDVEPNRGPPAEDPLLLKAVRVQKGV